MRPKGLNFGNPHRCRVLVFGEPSVGSYIRHRLERRGCLCSLAASIEEALALARRHDFRLVISMVPLASDHPLVSQFSGSQCTILAYQPSEGVSCWLPVINCGRKCPGVSALTPTEFIDLVDRILAEGEQVTAA
jgi:hypothetical protein